MLALTTMPLQWHGMHGGRECNIPKISTTAPTRIQNIRRASFTVNGPHIFNSLPQYIRDTTKCDENVFKAHLDHYLQQVPDQPLIPGYTPTACVTQIAWETGPGMPSWKHSWRNPQEWTLWRQERGCLQWPQPVGLKPIQSIQSK